MKRLVLLLMFMNTLHPVQAQSDIYLFIDSTTIIGKISDKHLYTGPADIGYTISGNMIYSGDTATKTTSVFAIDAKDILGNKTGVVFQPDGKTVQYIIMKGSFFLGDYPIKKEDDILLTLVPENDSLVRVFHGYFPDSLIGTIEGAMLQQAQIVAAAHMYIKHYQLDEGVRAHWQQLIDISSNSVGGLIHPTYDRGPYYEWVWDGKTLKPYWGFRPEDEWVFDGKYLKPVWSADVQSEWVWDGTILKPYWDQGVEHQWIWQDGRLKPFWNPNPDLEWVLEDGTARPMWRFNTAEEWTIEGDIPLPVIALVLLGVADR